MPKARTSGEVVGGNLIYATPTQVTINTEAELVAAAVGGADREVTLFIDDGEDTGIYINFGATATISHFLLKAGISITLPTGQAIRAVKAGSAAVKVHVLIGAPE